MRGSRAASGEMDEKTVTSQISQDDSRKAQAVSSRSLHTAHGKGKDAIFDLMDAVLSSPRAKSFVEVSLSPVFRRGWSSVYAGLRSSRPQRQKLMKVYIEQMPTESRPLLAGDHTAWSGSYAVTLKDRKIEHQPTRVCRQQANCCRAWIQHYSLDTRSTRKLGFTTAA